MASTVVGMCYNAHMSLIQNPDARNSPRSFQHGARKKTAIVLSGGGMQCVYQVGVLQALREKFSLSPDILVGSSGSAGTVAYFCSGQYDDIKHIWLDLLSTEMFIAPWRLWKIMDIDYLIDTVFKKTVPLRTRELAQTKIKYFISATDYQTGQIVYFTNGAEQYIFDILRASKAIPVAYNKKICIDGACYIDGYVGTTIEQSAQKAEDAGAEIIIAVDNSTDNSPIRAFFLTVYGYLHPALQKTIKKYLRATRPLYIHTKKKTPVILIKPSKKLPTAHALDNNREKLIQSFHRGYDDACSNAALLAQL